MCRLRCSASAPNARNSSASVTVRARQFVTSSASDTRPTAAKIQNGGSDVNCGESVGSHSQMTLFMACEACTSNANDSNAAPRGLTRLASSMPIATAA